MLKYGNVIYFLFEKCGFVLANFSPKQHGKIKTEFQRTVPMPKTPKTDRVRARANTTKKSSHECPTHRKHADECPKRFSKIRPNTPNLDSR